MSFTIILSVLSSIQNTLPPLKFTFQAVSCGLHFLADSFSLCELDAEQI